jgi:hypothetical protein
MTVRQLVRRSLIALALATLASLGAWSATAFGEVGPSAVTLPTTVTVPPPPVTLPVTVTVPPPPVTVTTPPPPVSVPTVTAPPATTPTSPVPAPSLPSAPSGALPSTRGGAPLGSAVAGAADSVVSTLPGSSAAARGSGPSGASDASGSASATEGQPAASGDGGAAEQQTLSRRRSVAARRVRGTRSVRPVPARFANRGANRRSTLLVFWLREPGRVIFSVLSGTPTCRALGSFAYRGHRGVNRVRYRGRLDGRPLPPGRYTLVPRVYRAGSVTQLERVTIQILRAGASSPLWRRAALVPGECRGDRLAGVYEPSGFAGDRFAYGAPAGGEERSGGVKSARSTNPGEGELRPVDESPGGEDGGLRIPTPFTDDGEGPPMLVAAAVALTGLGLAIMTLVVLLFRYVRGSWNP